MKLIISFLSSASAALMAHALSFSLGCFAAFIVTGGSMYLAAGVCFAVYLALWFIGMVLGALSELLSMMLRIPIDIQD